MYARKRMAGCKPPARAPVIVQGHAGGGHWLLVLISPLLNGAVGWSAGTRACSAAGGPLGCAVSELGRQQRRRLALLGGRQEGRGRAAVHLLMQQRLGGQHTVCRGAGRGQRRAGTCTSQRGAALKRQQRTRPAEVLPTVAARPRAWPLLLTHPGTAGSTLLTVRLQLLHNRLAGAWPHRDAADCHTAGPALAAQRAARAIGLHADLINLCLRRGGGQGRAGDNGEQPAPLACQPGALSAGKHAGKWWHAASRGARAQYSTAAQHPGTAPGGPPGRRPAVCSPSAHRCRWAFGTWPQ